MKTKRGFLLMNVGSPDEPTEEAVRDYLKTFHTDELVDLPNPARSILNKVTHPHHPARLAEAYKTIWLKNGCPLIHHCSNLTDKLRERLDEPVELAMISGKPSVEYALSKLLDQGVDEIGLLPMFPQYGLTTTGACVAKVKKILKRHKYNMTLRVIDPFYNQSAYLEPLAESIKNRDETILFSYHGLPNRHLKKAEQVKGDEHTYSHCLSSPTCCAESNIAHDTCYRFQCLTTSRELAKTASIPADRCITSFQSHSMPVKRMEPYTEETLQKLPRNGVKKLAVICPSFYCDDLETLLDIGISGREAFTEAGGESFRVIPCLNDSKGGTQCMELLMADANSWPNA